MPGDESVSVFLDRRAMSRWALTDLSFCFPNVLLLDFNENASNNLPEELGLSQEDRRFLTKVTKGVRLTEGHYEIPLPFRQSEVDLPNNRQQAVKRAL